MNSELLQGFLAQAESYLPTIRSGILVCAQTGNIYGELNTSLRQISSIKDAALIVELDEILKTAGELEEKLKDVASLQTPLTGEQSRGLLDKLIELEAMVAHIHFNTEDFSVHLNDFLDQSFENLGLIEPVAQTAVEAADEWEEEFEIDEEMLEIFGEEAEELIGNIRANVERLEKNTNDREALLEVRRNAHTLKGSAGIIGLKVLSGVAHRVEDLLDYLAENEIDGNEKIFELLLTSTDCFGALATGETSAQLTKKIEQLYLNFDALTTALNSQPTAIADELNQAETKISDDILQIDNQFEVPILKSEITKEQVVNPEQTAENLTLKTEDIKPNLQSEIPNHKSVVRVSLEKLDDLVKIMSGLVVSRSVFEQRLAELEQQIGELHNSTRRLLHSTAKMETDFEADMLNAQGSRFPVSNSNLQTHSFTFQSASSGQFENINLKSEIKNP
nr:Hpt domain-containing protein [Acidobacteriota bacterium]